MQARMRSIHAFFLLLSACVSLKPSIDGRLHKGRKLTMTRPYSAIILFCFAGALLAVSVFAQATGGSILGTIFDPAGGSTSQARSRAPNSLRTQGPRGGLVSSAREPEPP